MYRAQNSVLCPHLKTNLFCHIGMGSCVHNGHPGDPTLCSLPPARQSIQSILQSVPCCFSCLSCHSTKSIRTKTWILWREKYALCHERMWKFLHSTSLSYYSIYTVSTFEGERMYKSPNNVSLLFSSADSRSTSHETCCINHVECPFSILFEGTLTSWNTDSTVC